MVNLQIREEFKKLIPPLSAEEFEQLEKNILSDGCRDPLVVWNNTIIDGHNRFAICQKHGIDFRTIEKEFDSETDVRVWMRSNQTGRRNISAAWRIELELANKEDLKRIGREKQAETLKQNSTVLSVPDRTDTPHSTHQLCPLWTQLTLHIAPEMK